MTEKQETSSQIASKSNNNNNSKIYYYLNEHELKPGMPEKLEILWEI